MSTALRFVLWLLQVAVLSLIGLFAGFPILAEVARRLLLSGWSAPEVAWGGLGFGVFVIALITFPKHRRPPSTLHAGGEAGALKPPRSAPATSSRSQVRPRHRVDAALATRRDPA